MKTIPKRDSALVELVEIEERMQSILRQIDKLEDIRTPRDLGKLHIKIVKLNQRHDKLWEKRARILRAPVREICEDNR